MTIPEIDNESLNVDMNEINESGAILTNDLRIRSLEKRISLIKGKDISAYWVLLSGLYCLCGNVADSIKAGYNAIKLAPSDLGKLSYFLVTLRRLGRYSEARKLLEKSELEMPIRTRFGNHLLHTASFSRLIALQKDEEMESSHILKISNAASKMLRASGISEESIIPMLDLAGDLLRENKLTHNGNPLFSVYGNDGVMQISLALNVSPAKIAELEWLYAERLFSQLPSAPASVVQVGFVSREAA